MTADLWKGLAVAAGLLLIIWSMIAAVRWAKKGGGGMAALAIFLQFFGGSIPPPRQTVEDAREAEGKKRSEQDSRPKE